MSLSRILICLGIIFIHILVWAFQDTSFLSVETVLWDEVSSSVMVVLPVSFLLPGETTSRDEVSSFVLPFPYFEVVSNGLLVIKLLGIPCIMQIYLDIIILL